MQACKHGSTDSSPWIPARPAPHPQVLRHLHSLDEPLPHGALACGALLQRSGDLLVLNAGLARLLVSGGGLQA